MEKARNVEGKQTDHAWNRLAGIGMQTFNVVILIAVFRRLLSTDEDAEEGTAWRRVSLLFAYIPSCKVYPNITYISLARKSYYLFLFTFMCSLIYCKSVLYIDSSFFRLHRMQMRLYEHS